MNDVLCNWHTSQNIRVLSRRRMKEERMGEIENTFRIVDKKLWGEQTTGKAEVNGRIILKQVLQKYNMMTWTVFIWLRMGISGELL